MVSLWKDKTKNSIAGGSVFKVALPEVQVQLPDWIGGARESITELDVTQTVAEFKAMLCSSIEGLDSFDYLLLTIDGEELEDGFVLRDVGVGHESQLEIVAAPVTVVLPLGKVR